MSERVRFIVSCLNAPPFEMGLRLVGPLPCFFFGVLYSSPSLIMILSHHDYYLLLFHPFIFCGQIDFDEKQPHELLQILLDVLKSIDSTLNSDIEYYFENDKRDINEILSILSIIRYKNMPTVQDEEELHLWIDRLCGGDKDVVHPILEFCFSQYEKVKKRAYLAPFLTPVQLPLDLTLTQSDDILVKLANRYQALQDEFKHVHMQYDNVTNQGGKGMTGEDSLIKEVETLREERNQLMKEVDALNRSNKNDEGFLIVLRNITALRQEEEKEKILRDRIDDQSDRLNVVDGKLKQLQRQLSSLKSITSSATGGSPEGILNEIKKQLAEITMTVRSDLVSQRVELQKKIDEIEGYNNGEHHSEDDLEEIEETARELEEEYRSKLKLLEEHKLKKSYSKIAIYQQVSIVQNNLIVTMIVLC